MKNHAISQEEAIQLAEKAANDCQLPQTVFFDGTDWLHTYATNPRLHSHLMQVAVTVLPRNYFS